MPFFDAVFEQSWLDFASQLGARIHPKSIKNHSEIEVKIRKPLDKDFFPFYMFFRAQDAPDIPKMAPQRRQDGSQDVAKTLPRPPRSSQDPSKTVQDAFKTAQDEPKTLQEASKSLQDQQNDSKMTLQAVAS